MIHTCDRKVLKFIVWLYSATSLLLKGNFGILGIEKLYFNKYQRYV